MAGDNPASLLCTFGNPLLDIVVKCDDDSLLVKYGLKPDDAIEVEQWQMPLFEEIQKYENLKYVPGGSALNTSRVFQRLVGTANAVTFMGCIGRDSNGEILKEKVLEDGLNVCYVYDDNEPTGLSVALVYGTLRSLCANIGAANCFKLAHLVDDDAARITVDSAEVLYMEGYFLTHSHDCAMYLGTSAQKSDKLFAINLSAVYVCREFVSRLLELIPFVDVIFGNGDEFLQFAQVAGIEKSTPNEIALEVCNKFKAVENVIKKNINFKDILRYGRIVVITQGSGPVVVAYGSKVEEILVPAIPEDEILDTIGAGDAFVGGFLSKLVKMGSLEDCVKSGIDAASVTVKNPGCTFPLLVTG